LSREFAIPIRRVEEIIDRMLPTFDAKNQLFAFKRELRRLEDLSGEFFAIAKRDKSTESAHLVARLNERICAMRGIGPMSMRTDPIAAQVADQPRSYDKITSVLMSLKYGPSGQPNGDGTPSDAPTVSHISVNNCFRERFSKSIRQNLAVGRTVGAQEAERVLALASSEGRLGASLRQLRRSGSLRRCNPH
jgi:hypothetical protein